MLFSAAFYSGLRNQFDYNSQMVLLNSLGSQGLRKLSNLLVEELLGVSPHSRGLAVLEELTITVLGLVQVPTSDILIRHTSLEEQVNGTLAASSKSTKHKGSGLAAERLLSLGQVLADLVDELILVHVVSAALGKRLDRGELGGGVLELVGEGLDSERSTGETGVESETMSS
ncbi:hypothetical protein HG530_011962 [Fusarium avenaceum]|nr:hypothetical protein HG530_011962 [Fusarium avenaceum]